MKMEEAKKGMKVVDKDTGVTGVIRCICLCVIKKQ